MTVISLEELPFNDDYAADVTKELDQQQERDLWIGMGRNAIYPALGMVALIVLLRVFKRTPVQEIPLGVPVGRLMAKQNGNGNGNGHGPGRFGEEFEPQPGVVTVEVLNRLIKENPTNMTQAIRDWMNKGRYLGELKCQPCLNPLKPPVEAGALNKTQKLAALLVMLGSESAAVILKQFQPREIEAISREMARFNLITREQQQEILMEFSDVAVAASTSVSAGVEVTRNTLEKALGSFKASDVLGRVTSLRAPLGAMQSIAEMDPRHIFNLLRDEKVQAITFIISHLSPEKAAQVLNLLRARTAGPGHRTAGDSCADAGRSRRKSCGGA